MTTRAEVITELRTWIGVPWRHQGRSRFGIDCIGLVTVAAAMIEGPDVVALHDRQDYARTPARYDFAGVFDVFCDRIMFDAVQDGDILVFADGPYPCHVAIAATLDGRRSMIHAAARLRKVSEELFTDFWRQKLTHCYTPRRYA